MWEVKCHGHQEACLESLVVIYWRENEIQVHRLSCWNIKLSVAPASRGLWWTCLQITCQPFGISSDGKAMWMLQRSTTRGSWANRNSPGAQKYSVTGNQPLISTQNFLFSAMMPWVGCKISNLKTHCMLGKKKKKKTMKVLVAQSSDCNSVDYSLCPWDSPGKNNGVSSPSFLQGNLPDPGIELGSPASQADF